MSFNVRKQCEPNQIDAVILIYYTNALVTKKLEFGQGINFTTAISKYLRTCTGTSTVNNSFNLTMCKGDFLNMIDFVTWPPYILSPVNLIHTIINC